MSGRANPTHRGDLGWQGREFRPLFRTRGKSRAVPVRCARPARNRAHRAARADRPGLALLSAEAQAGAALWLSRLRPLPSRNRDTASTPTSCCSIRMPRRSAGSCAGAMPTSATRLAPSRKTCRSTGATTPPAMPKCQVIDPAFNWGDDRPPRHRLERHDHLRAARQGLHPAASRRSGGAARHLRRPGQRAGHRASAASRRHRRRADAGACFVDDRHLVERGLHNYWGYNSIGFFAPDRAIRRRDDAVSASSRPWSRRCTAPASR